jgi:hypothetical protein
MYTTGPLFLSAIWIEYLHGEGQGGSALERLRVLVKGPVKGDNYGFFKNIQGGSWHGSDFEVIFWMGDHLIIVTLLGFVIGISAVVLLWSILRRCLMMFRSKRWWEQQRERWKPRGSWQRYDDEERTYYLLDLESFHGISWHVWQF